MLAFASKALDNDAYKFSHDDGAIPNLNYDGGNDLNRTHHVKYPIKPGNAYEIILPAQKAYLERYFEYLKNN